MDKYTKRASSRIMKEALKFNPKLSGNTTFDQAFVLLMTNWDMELSIETTKTGTKCSIYRDGEITYTFKWTIEESWSDKDRDWNWDFIYKTVLEHIIKTRMYKRAKSSKRVSSKKSK